MINAFDRDTYNSEKEYINKISQIYNNDIIFG